MKHFCYLFIYFFIMSLSLTACSDESLTDENQTVVKEKNMDCRIVYPLSASFKANKPQTRNGETSFEEDWENKTTITINSGAKVNLPWAALGDANLPAYMVDDIKKCDGWEMILHTFDGVGVENDMNYMIFHNIRTGMLKVFYYLETMPQMNNNGIWELSFDQPKQLFNATRDFTFHTGKDNSTHWTSTNMTLGNVKGFRKGWNGFQVMLTYDPSDTANNNVMRINAYNSNLADIDLFLNLKAYSEGAVITQTSNDKLGKLQKKLVTLVGDGAEKWINDKINKEKGLIAKGAKGLVKAGLNKLLSNFTGSYSKTGSQTDIRITTTIADTITGDLSFPSTPYLQTFKAKISDELIGGKLGAWNLTERPIVYLDPRAGLVYESTDDGRDIAKYRGFGSAKYVYTVSINPRLKPYVIQTNETVDFAYSEYKDYPYNESECGTAGTLTLGNTDIHYDRPNKFQSKYSMHNIRRKYGKCPPAICIEDEVVPNDVRYKIKCAHFRLTLEIVTEIEGKRDTTVATRTFVPEISWDPIMYKSYKGYDFSKFDWYSCPPEIYNYPDNNY